MNDWKPAGYPSLSPYLICDDAPALITFLQQAFDGKLLRRFDRPDGSLMHAEVRIDDSVLMIGGAATDARSARSICTSTSATFARHSIAPSRWEPVSCSRRSASVRTTICAVACRMPGARSGGWGRRRLQG